MNLASDAHRQPQRIADGQPVARHETAADQQVGRIYGQPVHQPAERLAPGKVRPVEGHRGQVDAVHAQQPACLLALANVGCGAIVAHTSRGQHPWHLEMLAHRQKEPAWAFLIGRGGTSGLAEGAALLRLLGALPLLGQVQVGAHLVVDLILQMAIQGDRH